MNKFVVNVCLFVPLDLTYDLLSLLGTLRYIELETGKSRVAVSEEVGFEVFFAVTFDHLYHNPETHIKFEAIYEQGTTDVLLNDVGLRFVIFTVHLDAYLERRLAQQFRELFE